MTHFDAANAFLGHGPEMRSTAFLLYLGSTGDLLAAIAEVVGVVGQKRT